MKIAILGFGHVGRTLAARLQDVGYEIIVGSRSVPEEGVACPFLSPRDAAETADVIVLAIPFHACAEVLPELADVTRGKTVIDCTNPLNPDWSPKLLGQEHSAGEEISRLLPEARIVKAFNTIFADVMGQAKVDGKSVTAFIAGDDEAAKQEVMSIARNIGCTPLDTGSLSVARYLESMAHLNIQIAIGRGGGTKAALVYLRD
ncbi:MAG: NADPH-dependent F420 reductase [Cyanobacteria bacterium P01_D01_bin.123]